MDEMYASLLTLSERRKSCRRFDAEKPVSEVLSKCREQGVLCLTAKDRLRLLPALNIPTELLEKAVRVIKAACA